MSLFKGFVNAEIQRTKALAIAMRDDPVLTGISVAVQIAAFTVGLWFIIHAAKWAFATITSAF